MDCIDWFLKMDNYDTSIVSVFVFKAPGPFSGEYNAFIMQRVFHGSFDETVCIDWSSNSKIISVGSKDMSVKLYAMEE